MKQRGVHLKDSSDVLRLTLKLWGAGDTTCAHLWKRLGRCQKHILRLQITMYDVLKMEVSQSHQNLVEINRRYMVGLA